MWSYQDALTRTATLNGMVYLGTTVKEVGSMNEKRIARHPRRVARQEKAAEMAREASVRDSATQLAMLDERLGEGQGAVKERARLEGRQ